KNTFFKKFAGRRPGGVEIYQGKWYDRPVICQKHLMTYVGCDEMSRMRQRDLSPYLLSPIFKSDIPGKRLRRKLLFLFCEKNSLNENIFLQNKNSVSGKIMNKETNILNNIRFEGIIEI